MAAVVAVAMSCECTMPTSCMVDFNGSSTPMMKATAVEDLTVNYGYRWTVFEHKATFRGCKPTTDYFLVKTPKLVKKCGLRFKVGETYTLTVRPSGSSTPPPAVAAYGLDTYVGVKCDYNKLWDDMPFANQTALYDMPVSQCDTYATA